MKDQGRDVRKFAATAVGNVGPVAQPAVSNLSASLQDENGDVGNFAACTLGRIRANAKAVIPHLITALQDENVCVCAALIPAILLVRFSTASSSEVESRSVWSTLSFVA